MTDTLEAPKLTPADYGKKRAAMPNMRDAQVLGGQRGGVAARGKSGRKPKPTYCRKCQVLCRSAREAWGHC